MPPTPSTPAATLAESGWDLAAFRRSSEQFRAAFDAALVGMAFLDIRGRFLGVNPAFARMLGRPADGLEGTRAEDALHLDAPDGRPDLRRALAGLVDGFDRATCYRRVDGSPVWVQQFTSLVRADGEPLYFAVQTVDLSGRREAEPARTDGTGRVPAARYPGSARTGASGPADPDSVSLRVLLAEDNAINQRVAQLLLRNLGHRVDTVENGALALAAVHRIPYDVVLMDVQMPEMDGLEATRRIREEIDPDRTPRIVAMTASVLVEDRTACANAGMDDYLAKPVRLEELGAAMNRVAMSRGHHAHSPEGRSPAPTRPNEAAPEDRVRDGAGPASTAPTAATPRDGSPTAAGADADTAGQERRMEAIRARVEELFGTQGDRVLFAQLADWFIDQTAAALGLLEEAVRQGNATATAEHAHRLKGTAANLGGTDLGELLEELQIQGRRRHLEPSAAAMVARLPRELALFCNALRTVSSEIC